MKEFSNVLRSAFVKENIICLRMGGAIRECRIFNF